MVQRFNRLRHNSVVGSDNKNCDVGNLRTTGTHCGERLVTRGVDERNCAIDAVVLGVHLVGTDVLGNSASLAGLNICVTNRVEQTSLSVIDVTHDGDNRWTNN